jgi:hypothetical protein
VDGKRAVRRTAALLLSKKIYRYILTSMGCFKGTARTVFTYAVIPICWPDGTACAHSLSLLAAHFIKIFVHSNVQRSAFGKGPENQGARVYIELVKNDIAAPDWSLWLDFLFFFQCINRLLPESALIHDA